MRRVGRSNKRLDLVVRSGGPGSRLPCPSGLRPQALPEAPVQPRFDVSQDPEPEQGAPGAEEGHQLAFTKASLSRLHSPTGQPHIASPPVTTLPTERDDTLAMTWPRDGQRPSRVELAPGYALRADVDPVAFKGVQASIGFEVTDSPG